MRELRLHAGSLIAIACAVGIGCAEQTTPATETANAENHGGNCKLDCDGNKQLTLLQLQDSMRALWTDHVAFTRFFIIESVAELPGASATAERLLRNQDDIGDAIKPFYGDAAGEMLSKLLREHIVGAVAVL